MNEMNEYKQLLVLQSALENLDYRKCDMSLGLITECIKPLKKWVNGRIDDIEDKINVINRLEGRR